MLRETSVSVCQTCVCHLNIKWVGHILPKKPKCYILKGWAQWCSLPTRIYIANKLSTSVSLYFLSWKTMCIIFFLCLVEVKILSTKHFDSRVWFTPLLIREISIPWHLWLSFHFFCPFFWFSPFSSCWSLSFMQPSHSPHLPTTPWPFQIHVLLCLQKFPPHPVLSTIVSSFQSKIDPWSF